MTELSFPEFGKWLLVYLVLAKYIWPEISVRHLKLFLYFWKKVKGDGAGIRQEFLEQMTFVFGSVLRFKFQYQLFDP